MRNLRRPLAEATEIQDTFTTGRRLQKEPRFPIPPVSAPFSMVPCSFSHQEAESVSPS